MGRNKQKSQDHGESQDKLTLTPLKL